MRYVYCEMHDDKPDRLPKGCERQSADGKWIQEDVVPALWGGLRRRWPAPAKAKPIAKKKAKIEYVIWTNNTPVPSILPEGCQYKVSGGRWMKEYSDPNQWGGFMRRWPKPVDAKPKKKAKPVAKAKPVYAYWTPRDTRPDTIPAGCEYQSKGRWYLEEAGPGWWDTLRRRWPKPVAKPVAKVEVEANPKLEASDILADLDKAGLLDYKAAEPGPFEDPAYQYWLPGNELPAQLPVGCEWCDKRNKEWVKEWLTPEVWSSEQPRRWPKPKVEAKPGHPQYTGVKVCSNCNGWGLVQGRGGMPGLENCPRCNGGGNVAVKDKKMLTKEEYELGLNKNMVPWIKLGELEKTAIRKAGCNPNSLDYLNTDGEWALKHEINPVFNPGMIYRVNPGAGYDGKPVVVNNIKGLELVFNTHSGDDKLRFTVGDVVTEVGIHDLLSGLRDPKHNHANMDIAYWFDQHRKHGMFNKQRELYVDTERI